MKKNKILKKTIFFCFFVLLLYISICSYFGIKFYIEFIILTILLAYIYIKSFYLDIINNSYKQLQILIPLFNDLDIKKKLPNTDGYAASPDFLFEIKDLIEKNSPKLILEAGSGVSTIISAYALKKYGGGKIISLDHDKNYAEKTKKELINHNLDQYAEVFYSPLINYNNEYFWYDINVLPDFNNIDLFIIDGPPKSSSKHARYPAVPLLFNKLRKNSIILLDDSNRKDEKEIVALWQKENKCFETKFIKNLKGTYVIKKIT